MARLERTLCLIPYVFLVFSLTFIFSTFNCKYVFCITFYRWLDSNPQYRMPYLFNDQMSCPVRPKKSLLSDLRCNFFNFQFKFDYHCHFWDHFHSQVPLNVPLDLRGPFRVLRGRLRDWRQCRKGGKILKHKFRREIFFCVLGQLLGGDDGPCRFPEWQGCHDEFRKKGYPVAIQFGPRFADGGCKDKTLIDWT